MSKVMHIAKRFGYCRIGSLEILSSYKEIFFSDHCRIGRLENSQCEIWELFHFHSSIRDAKIYMMNDGDNIGLYSCF